MTVRQLLNTIDSRELSEWYIIEDMDFWKKRIADEEAKLQSSDYIIRQLFGKAIDNGDVVWREKQ